MALTLKPISMLHRTETLFSPAPSQRQPPTLVRCLYILRLRLTLREPRRCDWGTGPACEGSWGEKGGGEQLGDKPDSKQK